MAERAGRRRARSASSAPRPPAHAVVGEYVDGLGIARVAPPATRRALAEALAGPPSAAAQPCAMATAGTRRVRLGGQADDGRALRGEVHLEEGGTLELDAPRAGRDGAISLRASAPIPPGVHRIDVRDGRRRHESFLLASPPTLAPQVHAFGRRLALFLPLHAVPGGPMGIATYGDLDRLARWARERCDGLVATLPLFPQFLDRPFDPSPYAPVSRLFWSELHVDCTMAPEWRDPTVARLVSASRFRETAARLGAARLADHRGSWRLLRPVLRHMAASARRSPGRWDAISGALTLQAQRYAEFRAAVDARGAAWGAWPARWRHGHLERDALDPRDVDLYVYAQALVAEQLEGLGRAPGRRALYLDLPVGTHAEGFDTWTRPELFLHGISAGAPPDALNGEGQVWGFPPLHPTAGRADGYAHLRTMLRRLFRVAAVLRIDHVMALYRLFCVPQGASGTEGAYLRYPEEELVAILLIEAARADAIVVGEDLGTIPPEVRAIMQRTGLLRMHVQQFEFDADAAEPARGPTSHAQASLNTHDMPTFASFWHGDDIRLRRELGFLGEAGARQEAAGRAHLRRALRSALSTRTRPVRTPRAAVRSLLERHARSDSPLMVCNLEDFWDERLPQNVPGTTTEYPNWRRRMSRTLRAVTGDRELGKELTRLAALQRRTGPAAAARAPSRRSTR